MKTTTLHLALALLAGTAVAQEPSGEQGHRPPPPPGPSPVLMIFDTDHDGIISAEEIEAASAALATLDRNGDGQIDREELRPPPPPARLDGNGIPQQGRPPGHRPPPPLIAALDTDKDGTLSAEELEAAPDSLLELDANGDGELSPEELFPHGPPPPPPGRHDGGPEGPEESE